MALLGDELDGRLQHYLALEILFRSLSLPGGFVAGPDDAAYKFLIWATLTSALVPRVIEQLCVQLCNDYVKNFIFPYRKMIPSTNFILLQCVRASG